MGHSFRVAIALFAGIVAVAGGARAQSDPPGRVGRLAFVDGTVSFHDAQQTDWAPAVNNTPLTSGDAVWTEPNSRSELSIAGARVRMDGGTQLDMQAIDDSQTRLQLDQGRIDVRTFTYNARQPYQIATPRGVVTLEQQGDYYVEAGSTQDPTRLGVRSGAAQIQAANGQVLAVRAGEIGEISGDYDSPQLRTMQTAPPPMPAYWAQRDREIVYDQPPQYISADVTGYEDLNYYGTWNNDPEYGEVWIPRAVAADWAPYRTGHWAFVQPWGWTWIDDQPWGFAPYHYGRWANRDGRWMWVAPQRDARPVYAPALVAFIGGLELSVALGEQSRAPVGWFPLGPREAYVPPYSTNRDYYRRINVAARVQDQAMEDRWQRAQRHEAIEDNRERNEQMMNRRFATVVPAAAFTRSEPVSRAALRVDPQKIAAAPIAPVAAPPAPTMSIRGTAQAQPHAQQANVPTAQTRFANMQAIGRPTATEAPRQSAPGPKFVARPATTGTQPGKPALPALAPRNPNAPAPAQPSQVQSPQPQPPQGQQPRAPAPNQANLPPVRGPQTQRPEPPHAEPQHPVESHVAPPPPATQQHVTPAPQEHVATPPPGIQQHVGPPQPHQAEAPRAVEHVAPQAQPQAQPQRQAAPPPAPVQHAPSPPPQQQAHTPAPPPPPQHQQQAQQPAPPHPAPAKRDDDKK